ncbi:DMSO/TMAO reductase YedYZ heme-binding membrane subunit [Aminobacter lissarensis]|uniref:DMSO/TMAO reductase YedYZ heme-binding membrane subunit n=1 Tax=Aminobacter carboxidus TaxID=376165 RepID=A0A8E1WEF9_9HYPH|nr:ferric reductase-like transmembrane domain-containing protein [Aminobacter lissarensis]MBB6466046.1 DMSO/TMAO reductase YedYZ heme-binding membrane subunit [Aminobacter lissarensis]
MRALPESASAWPPNGWRLTAWLGAGVLAACAGAVSLADDPVDGTRMVIRLTARSSLMLFVLAFTASSLAQLWLSAMTRWIRANRRYFGLAFAFSHGVHAAAIIALSQLDPVLFDELTAPAAFIAGGTGYLAIILMAATSFDRTAAAIGLKAWRIIHTGGAWFLAVFFVVNFGRRAVLRPELYWPYMALILAAIALRLVAHFRNRNRDAATQGA